MVRIGTSGWHYKHWLGAFYPEKLPARRMLPYYAQHFRTVELNTTFYRLPLETGLEQWRAATPDDFCFAAKGSRFLTHMKKLSDTGVGIERFFERVERLGDKLGPIVWQLPPFWEVNAARLDAFLAALPTNRRHAFELRNPTWRNDQVYAILRRHNAAFCIFEIAGMFSGIQVTADFAYVRLHGPGGAYQGSYSDAVLGRWAGQILEWRRKALDVYVYFDNDQAGYAAQNALTLNRLVAADEMHTRTMKSG